jgi:hypothetical protein
MDTNLIANMNTLLALGLTGLILGGVAVLLLVIGWFQGREARAAASWNSTQGEIMETIVEKYQYSSSEGGTSTGYRPRIIYGYRVNGKEYVGERLNFGTAVHSSIKGLADNKAKQFPTGSRVTVYYNPNDPNDATLERKTPATTLLYVIGAVMFLAAIGTCASGFIFQV